MQRLGANWFFLINEHLLSYSQKYTLFKITYALAEITFVEISACGRT
jgi:hypothetical protein